MTKAVQFDGHKFEQTPGNSEGQGSLACCSLWSQRVGHSLATEQQGCKHPQETSNPPESGPCLLLQPDLLENVSQPETPLESPLSVYFAKNEKLMSRIHSAL